MINIEKRIHIDAFRDAKENKEYHYYLKKLHEVEHRIINLIGDHKLLLECESLICMVNNIHMESVYKFGFFDGEKHAQNVPECL